MRGEIEREGGEVEKFIGDAVVAVFGAPVAHEDDPVRATRVALALHERVATLSDALVGIIDVPLSLRIGIATGEVLAAVEGSDAPITGETSTIAARLQTSARPGAIVVDERTRRRSRHVFDFRSLGPLSLKGVDRPISAWEVLDALATPPPPMVSQALVGREREVARAVELLEGLRSGRGRVLVISGEPGTGKSRLLVEVRALAVARGLTVLESRAPSLPASSGYSPFRELFADLLDVGVESGGSADRSWARCEAAFRELAPQEADELLPYAGILAGLEVPEALAPQVRYLDGASLRGQVFRTARRLVVALAESREIVLMLDDAHWFDPSSGELTEHLVPLVRSVPLAILITTRTDPRGGTPPLVEGCRQACPERFTRIDLAPLDPRATARLVAELLPGAPVPDELVRPIARRSGGVPLFVEELVAALRDTSAIVQEETGAWRLAGPVDDVALPDTLRGLVAARLDALPRSSKDLVKKASVVGRTFSEEILERVIEGSLGVRGLSELERVGLLRRVTGEPGAWEFRHPLIQETAYASLLHRDRRTLHDLVAGSIEAVHSERLGELAAVLAHHYVQAERWDRAQGYLFEAGDRASYVAADAETVDLYRGALRAYERAFGERWDPLERAMLERRLGEALFRRGDHAQAIEHLRTALGSLGTRDPYASTHVKAAIARAAIKQLAHLVLHVERRAPSGRADATAEERARTYHVMAWIDFFTDPRRFLLNRLITAEVEERAGASPLGLALAYSGIGGACDIVPALRTARRYHRRAVQIAEDSGHPLAIGQTHFVFSLHEQHGAAALDAALEHCRTAAIAYREAGELRGAGAAEWFIAWIDSVRGDFQRSVERWTSLEALGRDSGDPALTGWALMGLGSLRWRSGELTSAVDALGEAVQLFESIPDHHSRAYAAGHLAIALVYGGDEAEAERVVADVESEIQMRGLRGFPCTPHRVAAAEVAVGSPSEGSRGRRRGRAAVRALLRQSKVDRDCLPDAWRLAGALAWRTGRPRRAEASWRRGLDAGRTTGAAYDEARILLEMSRRLGDAVSAEEVDRLLSAMGVAADDSAFGIGPGVVGRKVANP